MTGVKLPLLLRPACVFSLALTHAPRKSAQAVLSGDLGLMRQQTPEIRHGPQVGGELKLWTVLLAGQDGQDSPRGAEAAQVRLEG